MAKTTVPTVPAKKSTPAAPAAKGKATIPVAAKAPGKPAAPPVTVAAKPPTAQAPSTKAEGKADASTVSPKEIQELRNQLSGKDKDIARLTGEIKGLQEKIAASKKEEDPLFTAAGILAFPRRTVEGDPRAALHGQLFYMNAYIVPKGGKAVEITGEPGIAPVLMTIPSSADPVLPGEKKSVNAVNFQNGLTHVWDTPGEEDGTFYGPPAALRPMDLVLALAIPGRYFDGADGMRYVHPAAYVAEDGAIYPYDAPAFDADGSPEADNEGNAIGTWIAIGKTPA